MIQIKKGNEPDPEPPENPEAEAVEVFSSPCGFTWDSLEPCREDSQDGEPAPADSDDGSD